LTALGSGCIVAAVRQRREVSVVVLIGGGVRSGKSRFALQRARQLGARRTFVATATRSDEEMAARIEAHVRERGDELETIEAPLGLCAALQEISAADVVVIDCLTLWLANALLAEQNEEAILAQVDALVTILRGARFHSVVVTNEVWMGIVPETALGRAFRDLSGRAHQRVAAAADEIYFAVLGTLLRLRPAPVVLVDPEASHA
jgi:adenosylcobinamide kinase/adenosylcobinamide-phosphate guanylyltransferase